MGALATMQWAMFGYYRTVTNVFNRKAELYWDTPCSNADWRMYNDSARSFYYGF